MDDLISRRTAINEFYKYPNIHWTTLDVMAKIDELPSAESERKHGVWKEITDRTMDCCYRCSECGFIRDAYFLEIDNFCPNCGADMRGKTHE